MSRLSVFFKDTDTQFGAFYPNHYLLAVFPNLADAESAKKGLHAGRIGHEVISASGDEVVQFAEAHRVNDGLWGALMTELSRALGTGAADTDEDLNAARNGAGFVAVYCPDDEAKTDVWRLLEPAHPIVARYYSSGGIEHL